MNDDDVCTVVSSREHDSIRARCVDATTACRVLSGGVSYCPHRDVASRVRGVTDYGDSG